MHAVKNDMQVYYSYSYKNLKLDDFITISWNCILMFFYLSKKDFFLELLDRQERVCHNQEEKPDI